MKVKFLAGLLLISLVPFTVSFGKPLAAIDFSDTVVIKDASESLSVKGLLSHYKDDDGKLTINDLTDVEFLPLNPAKIPSLGFNKSVHWFKLNIHNQTSDKNWYLEVGYPPLDLIEFYFQDSLGNWQMKRSGDMFPISSREVHHRNVIFKFNLITSKTFYIKVKSNSSLQIPFIIWSPHAFELNAYQNQFANGIFYGIILIMVFYNLFLFLSVRDLNTLYYILTLLTGANVIGFFQGYGFFYLYPEHPRLNDLFSVISGPLFIVSSLQLTRSFLTLRTFSYKLDRMLISVMIVTLLTVAAIAIFPKSISMRPLHLLTLFNCTLIFISSVYCLLKKYRPARYFFLAWITVLFAALLFSLRNLGVISGNWINSNILYFGGIMQTLLISFALGDRIKLLEKVNKEAQEKDRYQELLMKEELAKQVSDRTQEIILKNMQLEELNMVKDKLFSIVSHDLKGPLNSLKGTLNILERGILGQEEFNNIIKGINNQLYQTTDLLETLLQWGRMQMKGEIFAPQRVNLSTLVKDTLSLIAAETNSKSIQIHNLLEQDYIAYADANMILTVIRNLLSNAVKFTNAGGVIRCMARIENDEIILLIRDSGTGIAPKYVKEIFTLKGVTTLGTREEKGTGIGLVLCKEFIEKNNGRIWCISEMGKGSEFSFALPKATI